MLALTKARARDEPAEERTESQDGRTDTSSDGSRRGLPCRVSAHDVRLTTRHSGRYPRHAFREDAVWRVGVVHREPIERSLLGLSGPLLRESVAIKQYRAEERRQRLS